MRPGWNGTHGTGKMEPRIARPARIKPRSRSASDSVIRVNPSNPWSENLEARARLEWHPRNREAGTTDSTSSTDQTIERVSIRLRHPCQSEQSVVRVSGSLGQGAKQEQNSRLPNLQPQSFLCPTFTLPKPRPHTRYPLFEQQQRGIHKLRTNHRQPSSTIVNNCKPPSTSLQSPRWMP